MEQAKKDTSSSNDHTLKLWDMETGACLQTIPLLWIPLEIKEIPGKPLCFASANANGSIALWDFRGREKLRR